MSSSERARGAKQLVDSEIPRTKRGKEETPTSNRRLGELFSTLLQNSPGPSDSWVPNFSGTGPGGSNCVLQVPVEWSVSWGRVSGFDCGQLGILTCLKGRMWGKGQGQIMGMNISHAFVTALFSCSILWCISHTHILNHRGELLASKRWFHSTSGFLNIPEKWRLKGHSPWTPQCDNRIMLRKPILGNVLAFKGLPPELGCRFCHEETLFRFALGMNGRAWLRGDTLSL